MDLTFKPLYRGKNFICFVIFLMSISYRYFRGYKDARNKYLLCYHYWFMQIKFNSTNHKMLIIIYSPILGVLVIWILYVYPQAFLPAPKIKNWTLLRGHNARDGAGDDEVDALRDHINDNWQCPKGKGLLQWPSAVQKKYWINFLDI